MLGGLALGPLVPVQVDPYRVWRVRVGLHEARSPLRIEDVPIEVVDEHGLAAEREVRVRVVTAVAPAAPRERLLLRDAEHHDPCAAVLLGLLHVLTRDVLLDHLLGEPHHLDPLALGERVDLLHVRVADLAEDHWRGDRPADPLIEEPDQQPLGLQRRHIPRQQDPID